MKSWQGYVYLACTAIDREHSWILPRRGTRGIEAEFVFDRVIHYRPRGKGVSLGVRGRVRA